MNCRSSVWTLAIGICLKSDSIWSDMKWNAAVPKCHTTCRWGLSHWGGGERRGTNWGLKVKGHREGRTSWSFHQSVMSSPHPPSPLLLPGLQKANNPTPHPTVLVGSTGSSALPSRLRRSSGSLLSSQPAREITLLPIFPPGLWGWYKHRSREEVGRS